MKKIAVLVSGGVDSSVALYELKGQGHDVTAFYLKIWLEDELSYLGECPWQEDLSYVTAVCDQLNVPLEVISLQREYWADVVSYTISEVKAGRTPNPDILCNQRIKFGAFFNKISDDYEYVATGHYAQTRQSPEGVQLVIAPDDIKDQTYFLSHLNQNQIKRALFPIGHMTKPEVRERARMYGVATQDRKDSQGICFLGKLKFQDFIRHHIPDQSGDLIEYETNQKIGTHKGFWHYTIGQRQGIGLSGGPWYVVSKDTALNRVFISKSYYAPDKERRAFMIGSCNWITQAPSKGDYSVKLRHGPQRVRAHVEPQEHGTYAITLQERDQGIAQGQFAVLYDGDVCLGGGTILRCQDNENCFKQEGQESPATCTPKPIGEGCKLAKPDMSAIALATAEGVDKRSLDMITLSTGLTLLRFLLTPCIVFAMFGHAWTVAFWLFAIAAITDVLDGYLARLLRQETMLGAYLDPIADKFLLVSCFAALGFIQSPLFHIPLWFVIVVLVKELLLMGGVGYLAFYMHKVVVRPSILGKLGTVVQVVFLTWLLLSASTASVNTVWYYGFIYAIVVLSVITLIDYARIGYKGCYS